MSVIKLVYDEKPTRVAVEVYIGERDGDGKHPSYTMVPAGMLTLTDEGWAALRDSLSRGVKKPHILLIEQGAE